jgi:hypothetical protein
MVIFSIPEKSNPEFEVNLISKVKFFWVKMQNSMYFHLYKTKPRSIDQVSHT